MVTYNYSEIFQEDPDNSEQVIITIPEDLCEQIGVTPGDTLTVTAQDGKISLKKSEK